MPRRDSSKESPQAPAWRHAAIAALWLLAAVLLAFAAWRPLLSGSGDNAVFWSALSACFTGASALGAVWVATQQQRWRKREERARAYVVAAGLTPALPVVIDALEVLAGQLQNVDGLRNRDAHHIESLKLTLQSTSLHVGVGAITDLVIISRDLAAKLAQAVSIVRRIEHRVNWTLQKLQTAEVAKHGLEDPEIKEWPDWADEARTLFLEVQKQCERDFAFKPKKKKTVVMAGPRTPEDGSRMDGPSPSSPSSSVGPH
ncbi:hypothetical protein QCE49_12820 [Caballeronia sp. LZ008]|uniref:hypothetical protein n=1 Tax=unclassified Caballeronia TaxID=2646786 RepID=UPI002027842E|nr:MULTISPECIES: hypothetical protein [unclassified Caballeronia]MDR5794256.1 hypothetical protein [Caballeronia sp. LZ008]